MWFSAVFSNYPWPPPRFLFFFGSFLRLKTYSMCFLSSDEDWLLSFSSLRSLLDLLGCHRWMYISVCYLGPIFLYDSNFFSQFFLSISHGSALCYAMAIICSPPGSECSRTARLWQNRIMLKPWEQMLHRCRRTRNAKLRSVNERSSHCFVLKNR